MIKPQEGRDPFDLEFEADDDFGPPPPAAVLP